MSSRIGDPPLRHELDRQLQQGAPSDAASPGLANGPRPIQVSGARIALEPGRIVAPVPSEPTSRYRDLQAEATAALRASRAAASGYQRPRRPMRVRQAHVVAFLLALLGLTAASALMVYVVGFVDLAGRLAIVAGVLVFAALVAITDYGR